MSDHLSLPPAADFGTAPTASLAGHHHENPLEIFHRVHRLLRGRYAYVLTLGAVGAIAGAILGYKATVPKYQSVGMIRIKSPQVKVYITPENQNQPPTRDVSSVAQYLKEPRVIERAMNSDEWKRTGRGQGPDAKDEFRDSLRVETDYNAPEWIYVKFTDKVAGVAKVAVEQTIRSFIDIHGKDGSFVTPELIADLDTRIKTINVEITQLQNQVKTIGREFGTTDLESLHRDSMEHLKNLDRVVNQLELQVKQAETAAQGPAQAHPAAPTPETDLDLAATEIAKLDEQMKNMLSFLSAAQSRVQQLRAQ